MKVLFTLKISKDLLDRARRFAKARDMAIADVFRMALIEYLNRKEGGE